MCDRCLGEVSSPLCEGTVASVHNHYAWCSRYLHATAGAQLTPIAMQRYYRSCCKQLGRRLSRNRWPRAAGPSGGVSCEPGPQWQALLSAMRQKEEEQARRRRRQRRRRTEERKREGGARSEEKGRGHDSAREAAAAAGSAAGAGTAAGAVAAATEAGEVTGAGVGEGFGRQKGRRMGEEELRLAVAARDPGRARETETEMESASAPAAGREEAPKPLRGADAPRKRWVVAVAEPPCCAARDLGFSAARGLLYVDTSSDAPVRAHGLTRPLWLLCSIPFLVD
ncbi:hypothetical protein BHM03_00060916 [Ensete ventricosum]|nr:hypothetical protein BHM03_00060916 [Ensete ventricosum]